uniref:Calcineurin B homologous protein 3 n=1 Tax=Fundulus heteroclitus TaxID=8078 RepID=A0A3Q2NVU8_FUNHE
MLMLKFVVQLVLYLDLLLLFHCNVLSSVMFLFFVLFTYSTLICLDKLDLVSCSVITNSLFLHRSREHLKSIPALANNPIRKQIIEAFFDKRNQHGNELGSYEEIGFEEFLMVMSHFRPPTLRTTEEEKEAMRKEKVRFLFNMHDTDGDGKITLVEYRKVVEELLSKSGTIGQEAAKAIADAAMLEVASTNVPNMVSETAKLSRGKDCMVACCSAAVTGSCRSRAQMTSMKGLP